MVLYGLLLFLICFVGGIAVGMLFHRRAAARRRYRDVVPAGAVFKVTPLDLSDARFDRDMEQWLGNPDYRVVSHVPLDAFLLSPEVVGHDAYTHDMLYAVVVDRQGWPCIAIECRGTRTRGDLRREQWQRTVLQSVGVEWLMLSPHTSPLLIQAKLRRLLEARTTEVAPVSTPAPCAC